MFKKHLMLIIILLASFCIWTMAYAADDAEMEAKDNKIIFPEAGYGMIYVVRSIGFWPQFRYHVYIDQTVKENMIGYTVGGQYLSIQVTPGEHIVYSVGENTEYIKLNVKEGDILFVEQQSARIDLKDGSNQDRLEIIPEIKGKQLLKRASMGWKPEH